MFGIGHGPEIIILLVIVLLVFGPGKLPEVGSAIGRGIREFRDATSGNDRSPTPPTISQVPPARPIQQPTQQWSEPA
jgi:sec-independent protein translocase protein TatA